MSEKIYKLEIVTPEKKAFSEDVVFSVFPGSEGELGILAGHAMLLARLNPGEIRITRPGSATVLHLAIAGGFLEVRNNQVSVLAETAETAAEIDRAEAQKAVTEAEEARKLAATPADRAAADVQLRIAIARLKVAGSAPGAPASTTKPA